MGGKIESSGRQRTSWPQRSQRLHLLPRSLTVPPLQLLRAVQLLPQLLSVFSAQLLPGDFPVLQTQLSLYFASSLFSLQPKSALEMWFQKWVFIHLPSLLVSQLENTLLKSSVEIFNFHCLPLDPDHTLSNVQPWAQSSNCEICTFVM